MAATRSASTIARCLIAMLATTVAVGAQSVTPQAVAERQVELQKLLDAYAAGQHGVVVGATRRRADGRVDSLTIAALNALYQNPKAPWQPARAAFALEMAADAYRDFGSMFMLAGVLTRARDLVIGRPAEIGANPAEDRFEVLFHQIALGLLEGSGYWDALNEYLTAIAPRIVRMSRATPPLPNRFALALAINDMMQCCRERLGPFGAQVIRISGSGSVSRPIVPRPDAALSRFTALEEDPTLLTEALVRGAWLAHRLDRHADALARLDRAGSLIDPALAYGAAIVRAGALDALGQPHAAAAAYQAALDLAPNAQVPAIGRAAALQRAGRIDEAVEAAALARRLQTSSQFLWLAFTRGDARFVNDWLTELRSLLK